MKLSDRYSFKVIPPAQSEISFCISLNVHHIEKRFK